MAGSYIGAFELLILASIVHLRDQAYGVRIRQEIESRAGHAVAIGAVYTTLMRLESKGLIRARLGEPTAARGGRAKRFFTLTAQGERALSGTVQALDGILSGLDLGWNPR